MRINYSENFARFWSAFPRHSHKGSAWKVFQKLAPNDDDVDTMIEALLWQREQFQWRKAGGQYIPHAATWLHARGWEDEPFHVEPPPRYRGWTCPHTPPCEQRHWCDLKTAKAVLGTES